MATYKNINVEKNKLGQSRNYIVSKRKLHIFSLFFICIITSGFMGFSFNNTTLKNEIKNITSSWSPNINDLGKLKFVNSETEEDVFLSVSNMDMPFDNTYVSINEDGGFIINGLGGLVVKCCLAGKVEKIEQGEYKTIRVSHGKGLVSIYANIDTVGVKEGDFVEKNAPLGVSLSSVINFKLLYRNKTISGLTVKDGEMYFS